MNDDQQMWVETMQNLLKLQPQRFVPEPSNDPPRQFFYFLVRSQFFEPVILMVILFNTILMALDGYGISDAMKAFIENANIICTIFFCFEAAIKIWALTFPEYIREPWNVFDFFVASISMFAVIAEAFFAHSGSSPSMLRALRTVRVLRILRTVKAFKGLRMLFTTLLLSMPALVNIISIFLIVLTLYSILGMHLFGSVAPGNVLNTGLISFCTFGTSLLTMLRCATGESWNTIMHDLMITPESIDAHSQPICSIEAGNCGNPIASVVFFVSFIVLSSFLILNMMIAMILEEYSKAMAREKHKINPDDSERFVEAWSKYDPLATGRMHVRHLHVFIRELPPPLGLDKKRFAFGQIRDCDISAYISSLDEVDTYLNPINGSPEVSFFEVLNALTKTVMGEAASEMEALTTESKVVQELKKMQEATAARDAAFEKPKNNLVELHSVCLIQRKWLLSAPLRHKRNATARREAIRLRQTGTLVPDSFSGRVQHSTIIFRGRVFVFGGRGEGAMLRDFWEFSLNAGYWVDHSHTVPLRLRPRCGHTALLCGTRMVIIGGHDGERFLSDVWECELTGLYWRQVGFTSNERKEQLARQIESSEKPAITMVDGSEPNGNGHQNGGSLAFAPLSSSGKRTKLQEAADMMRSQAAEVLQAHARARTARLLTAWRRAQADLEYDAATYVQAINRGKRTRARLQELIAAARAQRRSGGGPPTRRG